MTDSDLRELDGWIAEKFTGWTRIPNSNPLAWVGYPGRIITWETTSFGDAFQPTRLPSAFALVKREIERRGWGWRCEYPFLASKKYAFEIDVPGVLMPSRYAANTEELAGCLAVKAALEVLGHG